MKLCFEVDDKVDEKVINKMQEDITNTIELRSRRYFAESKYTFPMAFDEKEEYPLFTREDIETILKMGLQIVVNHGWDDCGGYGLRIKLFDPESNIGVREFSYHPGWSGDDKDDLLAPFQKFKCKNITIKEY
jgi:hypothetical protein